MKVIGYFVCMEGLIWTVYCESGLTFRNGSGRVIVEGDKVSMGEYEDGQGIRIDEEYTLHKTLTNLAKVLES